MFSILNLILTLVFLYGIYYLFRSKRKGNLPPGPWNIPFVGGFYSTYPHKTFQQHAKKYGPLIRTKFGLQDALVIDDVKLLREAYNMNAFNGKMALRAFVEFAGGKHGIVSAEGQEWSEQRRFVLRALREFGFGKRSMELLVTEEVNDFLQWMKANQGIPTEIRARLSLATVSTLWTMLAGERQDQNNDVLQDILDRSSDIFNALGQSIWMMFPQLIDILPKIFLKSWYHALETAKPFMKIFSDTIEFHRENPVDSSQPRDLIDVYLTEVQKTTDPNSSFYGERGLKSLRNVVNDIYGAGQATTSSLLTWAVLYLVRFPKIQEKFQKELDAVIGPNRLPTLADRPNLPYTEALIMEIMRFTSMLPLGLFHETMEDTKLGGYDIKKGTVIVPNFYSMDHSEKTYGDPHNFRPERFLSPDEQSVIKPEDWIPFSTGKRQCLGETMGRDSSFLFLTAIFQRFQIRYDPSKRPPSIEPPPGIFREPEKFSVVFEERQ